MISGLEFIPESYGGYKDKYKKGITSCLKLGFTYK